MKPGDQPPEACVPDDITRVPLSRALLRQDYTVYSLAMRCNMRTCWVIAGIVNFNFLDRTARGKTSTVDLPLRGNTSARTGIYSFRVPLANRPTRCNTLERTLQRSPRKPRELSYPSSWRINQSNPLLRAVVSS